MAIVESGTVGRLPSVEECQAHPSLSQVWGIENTSSMIVGGKTVDAVVVPPVKIGDTTIEFYRHPELLISDTIRLWETEYETVMEYEAKKQNSDEYHPCFIEAGKIYKNYKGALSVE